MPCSVHTQNMLNFSVLLGVLALFDGPILETQATSGAFYVASCHDRIQFSCPDSDAFYINIVFAFFNCMECDECMSLGNANCLNNCESRYSRGSAISHPPALAIYENCNAAIWSCSHSMVDDNTVVFYSCISSPDPLIHISTKAPFTQLSTSPSQTLNPFTNIQPDVASFTSHNPTSDILTTSLSEQHTITKSPPPSSTYHTATKLHTHVSTISQKSTSTLNPNQTNNHTLSTAHINTIQQSLFPDSSENNYPSLTTASVNPNVTTISPPSSPVTSSQERTYIQSTAASTRAVDTTSKTSQRAVTTPTITTNDTTTHGDTDIPETRTPTPPITTTAPLPTTQTFTTLSMTKTMSTVIRMLTNGSTTPIMRTREIKTSTQTTATNVATPQVTQEITAPKLATNQTTNAPSTPSKPTTSLENESTMVLTTNEIILSVTKPNATTLLIGTMQTTNQLAPNEQTTKIASTKRKTTPYLTVTKFGPTTPATLIVPIDTPTEPDRVTESVQTTDSIITDTAMKGHTLTSGINTTPSIPSRTTINQGSSGTMTLKMITDIKTDQPRIHEQQTTQRSPTRQSSRNTTTTPQHPTQKETSTPPVVTLETTEFIKVISTHDIRPITNVQQNTNTQHPATKEYSTTQTADQAKTMIIQMSTTMASQTSGDTTMPATVHIPTSKSTIKHVTNTLGTTNSTPLASITTTAINTNTNTDHFQNPGTNLSKRTPGQNALSTTTQEWSTSTATSSITSTSVTHTPSSTSSHNNLPTPSVLSSEPRSPTTTRQTHKQETSVSSLHLTSPKTSTTSLHKGTSTESIITSPDIITGKATSQHPTSLHTVTPMQFTTTKHGSHTDQANSQNPTSLHKGTPQFAMTSQSTYSEQTTSPSSTTLPTVTLTESTSHGTNIGHATRPSSTSQLTVKPTQFLIKSHSTSNVQTTNESSTSQHKLTTMSHSRQTTQETSRSATSNVTPTQSISHISHTDQITHPSSLHSVTSTESILTSAGTSNGQATSSRFTSQENMTPTQVLSTSHSINTGKISSQSPTSLHKVTALESTMPSHNSSPSPTNLPKVTSSQVPIASHTTTEGQASSLSPTKQLTNTPAKLFTTTFGTNTGLSTQTPTNKSQTFSDVTSIAPHNSTITQVPNTSLSETKSTDVHSDVESTYLPTLSGDVQTTGQAGNQTAELGKGEESVDTAIIVGSVLGSLLLVVLIILAVLICRKRRTSHYEDNTFTLSSTWEKQIVYEDDEYYSVIDEKDLYPDPPTLRSQDSVPPDLIYLASPPPSMIDEYTGPYDAPYGEVVSDPPLLAVPMHGLGGESQTDDYYSPVDYTQITENYKDQTMGDGKSPTITVKVPRLDPSTRHKQPRKHRLAKTDTRVVAASTCEENDAGDTRYSQVNKRKPDISQQPSRGKISPPADHVYHILEPGDNPQSQIKY